LSNTQHNNSKVADFVWCLVIYGIAVSFLIELGCDQWCSSKNWWWKPLSRKNMVWDI